MNPNSCANCWFNALQHDTVGLNRGFCVRHKLVLNVPSETTCGLLMRKDLGVVSAERLQAIHSKSASSDGPSPLWPAGSDPRRLTDTETKVLEQDHVAAEVVDYGRVDSSIATLARLSALPGARAEIGMLSLGRGYVRNCAVRDRRWTSGIHLFRWTVGKLGDLPVLEPRDFFVSTAVSLGRQLELAQWSILMLRIRMLDDIAHHARTARGDVAGGDDLAALPDLADAAAESVPRIEPTALVKWIRSTLAPRLQKALPTSAITDILGRVRSQYAEAA